MARTSAVIAFLSILSLSHSFSLLFGGGQIFDGYPSEGSDYTSTLVLLVLSLSFLLIALICHLFRLFDKERISSKHVIYLSGITGFCVLCSSVFSAISIAILVRNNPGLPFGFFLWQSIFGTAFGFVGFLCICLDFYGFSKSLLSSPSVAPLSTSSTLSNSELQYRNIVNDQQRTFVVSLISIVVYLVVGGFVFIATDDWTYTHGVAFSIVTLTTIGYGYTTPSSEAGRIFVPLYGILGIGLMGFFLSSFASMVVGWIERVTAPVTSFLRNHAQGPSFKAKLSRSLKKRVKIIAVGLISISYWLLGAMILAFVEGWTYLDAYFFTFETLSTVGYGSQQVSTPLGITILYYFIFFGLGLFAVFVNEIWIKQEGDE